MLNAQQRAAELEAETAGQNAITPEGQPEPSWFPEAFRTRTPEEIAESYRAFRMEIEERGKPSALDRQLNRNFELVDTANEARQRAQQMPPRRPLPQHHIDEGERHYPEVTRPPRRRATPTNSGRRASTYAALGIAAILAGGALGYGATQLQEIGAKAQEIMAMVLPQMEPVKIAAETPVVTETIIAKKPIATATLTVGDVSGELNSMIPLMLHAEPALGGEDIILKISGLPQSAYLTAGSKAQDNAWHLAAKEADGVKLVVPQTTEPRFDVSIAAVEARSGELAAPVREMSVAIKDAAIRIAPVSAVPEGVIVKSSKETAALKASAMPKPKEQQTVSASAQNLVAKGDILLKSGDIAMARQFYEQAFAQGSTEAAMGAGKTFDPVVYEELKVQGLKPDPLLAMEWYMRASAAGNIDAEAAIAALRQAAPR